MVQTSHTDDVTTAAFSADGRQVITGSHDNTAKLWQIKSNKLLYTFVHDAWVRALTFSLDGSKMLAGLAHGDVVVWDAKARKLIHQFTAYSKYETVRRIERVMFSSDGTKFITVSYSDHVKLWDANNYQLLHDFKRVPAVNFSPDGRFIFVFNADKQKVVVWDAKTVRPIDEVMVTSKANYALAASPDGSQLLIGGGKKVVELWDVKTKKLIKVFKGHADWLKSMTFSPDGRQMLTGDGNGFVKLWNVKNGALIHTFKMPPKNITKLAYSPQSKHILAVCEERHVSIWDLRTKKQAQKIIPNKSPVTAVAFSPNSHKTLLGINGLVKLWNTQTGKFEGVLNGYKPGDRTVLKCITVLPDNSGLLTGHRGRRVQLWSLKTSQLMHTFISKGGAQSIKVSPDGSKMLVGTWSSAFELWDLKTKQSIFKDSWETKYTAWNGTEAIFSPDGSKILAHAFRDRLGLWSVKYQLPLHTFYFSKNRVEIADFSSDGSKVFALSLNDTLKKWDTKTFKLVKKWGYKQEIFHTGSVLTAKEDRQLIGTNVGKAIMWDIAQNRRKESIDRHTDGICAITFSPKEDKVLTGSQDGSAKIWDVKTRKLLCTIHANFEDENAWLIVTPDGKYDGNKAGIQYLHLVDSKQQARPIQKNDSKHTKGLLKKILNK